MRVLYDNHAQSTLYIYLVGMTNLRGVVRQCSTVLYYFLSDTAASLLMTPVHRHATDDAGIASAFWVWTAVLSHSGTSIAQHSADSCVDAQVECQGTSAAIQLKGPNSSPGSANCCSIDASCLAFSLTMSMLVLKARVCMPYHLVSCTCTSTPGSIKLGYDVVYAPQVDCSCVCTNHML